jgi:DNA-binding NarL/FixJ family response regulator
VGHGGANVACHLGLQARIDRVILVRQPKGRLSPREIEVLRLISRRASNKDAARELDLSPGTVRTHVESLFRKLECSTRAAATLKASSMGVL